MTTQTWQSVIALRKERGGLTLSLIKLDRIATSTPLLAGMQIWPADGRTMFLECFLLT